MRPTTVLPPRPARAIGAWSGVAAAVLALPVASGAAAPVADADVCAAARAPWAAEGLTPAASARETPARRPPGVGLTAAPAAHHPHAHATLAPRPPGASLAAGATPQDPHGVGALAPRPPGAVLKAAPVAPHRHAPGVLARRPPGPSPQWADLVVDTAARTVTLTAVAQPGVFRASSGPDDHYHAIVSRAGGAAGKALLVTDAGDAAVAAALRSLGAEDGGGVPMSAWELRSLPLVPGPNARVRGSSVRVTLTWEGAGRDYEMGELLDDPGAEGVEVRFGGNEEHDEHWGSGCILCLFSCPGGVLSNARYSIRDHVRERTRFEPADGFPDDGTVVTVTLQLLLG